MTQEQFSSLQELHRLSGLSLVKFLQREHVSYSTYNYWKRKSSSVPRSRNICSPISLSSHQPQVPLYCFLLFRFRNDPVVS